MEIVLLPDAKKDLEYWKSNKAILKGLLKSLSPSKNLRSKGLVNLNL